MPYTQNASSGFALQWTLSELLQIEFSTRAIPLCPVPLWGTGGTKGGLNYYQKGKLPLLFLLRCVLGHRHQVDDIGAFLAHADDPLITLGHLLEVQLIGAG
jgi:hypothetical protein